MLFIQLAPISSMPTTRVIAVTAPFTLFLLTLRRQRKQHTTAPSATSISRNPTRPTSAPLPHRLPNDVEEIESRERIAIRTSALRTASGDGRLPGLSSGFISIDISMCLRMLQVAVARTPSVRPVSVAARM
jgi:hypothetical protein